MLLRDNSQLALIAAFFLFYLACFKIYSVNSTSLPSDTHHADNNNQLDTYESDLDNLHQTTFQNSNKRREHLSNFLNKLTETIVENDQMLNEYFQRDLEKRDDSTSSSNNQNEKKKRRLTNNEKKLIKEVVSANLINKLKDIYAITTRSR